MTDDGTESIDDHATLVGAATAGSAPALAELVARHLPQLEAYVRLKAGAAVRARESLSDVVQSVCVEVLRNSGAFEYRGETKFVHWLCRNALHKIIDKGRFHVAERRDIAREVRVDAAGFESADGMAADLLATMQTPSRIAMSREKMVAFAAAFDELPADYRQAVALSRVVGLGYPEIAAEMQRSEGAVRNLVYRGIARLSTTLERLLGDDSRR